MDEEAWKAEVHGVAEGRTQLNDCTFTFHFSCTGEGNGNPLQCSCLENPRDRGAWWAAIYGVTQSRTWLKWLSNSSIQCGDGDMCVYAYMCLCKSKNLIAYYKKKLITLKNIYRLHLIKSLLQKEQIYYPKMWKARKRNKIEMEKRVWITAIFLYFLMIGILKVFSRLCPCFIILGVYMYFPFLSFKWPRKISTQYKS